jgi:hypothetical protein
MFLRVLRYCMEKINKKASEVGNMKHHKLRLNFVFIAISGKLLELQDSFINFH